MEAHELESRCDSEAGGLGIGWIPEPWLAVYTRPRHEQLVERHCAQRRIECFLPSRTVVRQWSDRQRKVSVPLFPSYVFVRPRGGEATRMFQAPGFLWYVRNQHGPVEVAEAELKYIRQLLASGWHYDSVPTAELGDEIEITAGPMRGCRGYLERKTPRHVILRVSAIDGSLRVRAEHAHLEIVKRNAQ